jgi:hypothetical protein
MRSSQDDLPPSKGAKITVTITDGQLRISNQYHDTGESYHVALVGDQSGQAQTLGCSLSPSDEGDAYLVFAEPCPK